MSIEFLSKGQLRRGVCEADKSWTRTIGLVSVGPCFAIRNFGTHDCSSGIGRRRTGRKGGDGTKDTSRPRERRDRVHRGEWWRPWPSSSEIRKTKTLMAQISTARLLLCETNPISVSAPMPSFPATTGASTCPRKCRPILPKLDRDTMFASKYRVSACFVSLMIASPIGRPAAPSHLRAAAQDSPSSSERGRRSRASRPEWRP